MPLRSTTMHVNEDHIVEIYKAALHSSWREIIPHSASHENLRQSCHAPQGHHESCKCRPWDRNLQGSPDSSLSLCYDGILLQVLLVQDPEGAGHAHRGSQCRHFNRRE